MIKRFVLFALASLCAGPLGAAAADDPVETAPGHTLYGDPAAPDISGLWLGSRPLAPGHQPQVPPEPGSTVQWFPWPPRLTPAYQKIADERAAARKEGRQLGDIGKLCLPFGVPRMLAGTLYPNEIVQTPNVVTLFNFGTFPIMIWTDGRPHPKDLKPSYNGHSIGHWEGDTLHVDTVGILPATVVEDDTNTPHSARLHVVTTIRKVAPDVVHVHITLLDEEAFTEPMVITNILRRKSGPKWQVLDDMSCFENNRTMMEKNRPDGFINF
ncbi:hypothetical protein [Sphingomonas bacterium]|uniref:hypothetical protein n=1 Tax=Sphingomonas bacterium TaxID=1895847 RepID=UPI001576E153|nr:hypothetical protein [Sphingomonas bacterium]